MVFWPYFAVTWLWQHFSFSRPGHISLQLKVINTQRVCMHSKARQSYSNLQTDASRRLTESTSGLSGTFFRKTKKGVFSIIALLERYEHYKLTGTKPPAWVHHFVHIPMFRIPLCFIRKASAIMVPHKRMRVHDIACALVSLARPSHHAKRVWSNLHKLLMQLVWLSASKNCVRAKWEESHTSSLCGFDQTLHIVWGSG